ncbi:MAG: MFS transporter [Phycicoccus sp.]
MTHPARARSPRKSGRAVLRRGGFVTFAIAYAASFLGDQMWFVTLGWAAAQLGSAQETALVMAVGSIPRAPLLLVGGAVADRYGPIRTSVTTQAARLVLLSAGAVLLLLTRDAALAVLVVVAFGFGVLDAIHTPALGAVPASLLPTDALADGQGILQGIQRLAMVLGAPAGGLAIAFGSVPAAIALVSGLFVLSWGGLHRLSRTIDDEPAPHPERRATLARAALDGVRTAARDPVTLAILVVMTALNFGLSGQLNVGMVLLSRENNWNATGFAALLSSFAVGAALGAFAVAGTRRARRPVVAAVLWVAAGATSLAALPIAPSVWAGCAFVAGAGLAFGPASALLIGTLQSRTAPSHMARITSLSTFASVGLTPIAYLVFGSVAEATSTATAFTAFAAIVIASCLATLCIRTVRAATSASVRSRESPW